MRQSGKTTQMLMRAAEAAADGRRVLIVVHDAKHIAYCMGLVHKYELSSLLQTRHFCTVRIAYQKAIRGLYARDIFVDHFVWENWTPDVDRLHDELENMRQVRQAPPPTFVIEDPDPWCNCEVHA